MDAEGPLEQFFKIPPVTRTWFLMVAGVTIASKFGFISLERLWFYIPSLMRGQVWRLITCFTYIGKLNFAWLMNIMMLCVGWDSPGVQYSWRYEVNCFPCGGAGGGTIADYVWTLVLGMAGLLVCAVFMGGMFLGDALSMFLIYIYSKRNPGELTRVWGLPPGGMPCVYLPFALLAMNVILDGDYMPLLYGIAVGHLYYYIKVVLAESPGPLQSLRHALTTPHLMCLLFQVEPTEVVNPRVTLLQLRQGGVYGALGWGCCRGGGRRMEGGGGGMLAGAWNTVMGAVRGVWNAPPAPPAPGFHRLDPVQPRAVNRVPLTPTIPTAATAATAPPPQPPAHQAATPASPSATTRLPAAAPPTPARSPAPTGTAIDAQERARMLAARQARFANVS